MPSWRIARNDAASARSASGIAGTAAIAVGGSAAVGGIGKAIRGLGRAAQTADKIQIELSGLPQGVSRNTKLVRSDSDLETRYQKLAKGGSDVTPATYPGTRTQLPDGTRIGLRETSSSGGRAIDIVYPNSRRARVHIDE